MLNERGAILSITLDDGRIADIRPLLHGTAQLCIDRPEWDEDGGYDLVFCYETPLAAVGGLAVWIDSGLQGEPQGWFRDPITGRRRPAGDPAKEFVLL